MRLFVAFRPSEEAIEDLDAFLDVRRETGDFRWTSADQWHLTLAFVADLPERKLDDLEVRLERAARKRASMTASLRGGGAFPHAGKAKVLWLGLDVDDPVELTRLATGCRAAVAKAGGEVEGQRFRAHLTLARVGRPIEATRWVRLLDAYDGPTWPIDRIDLVASHLGEGPRRRPRHEVIGTWPIGPAEQPHRHPGP